MRDAPDFRFNIARMLDSDWYHSCSTREALAGINLHARAIHQVPAGSLPSSDALLARLADFGRDVDGWREVKAKALEGWVLCSDGRLYHPDVARNALHIWIGRMEKRRASAVANLAKAPERDFGIEEITAAFNEACNALRAIDPQDGMLREATARAMRGQAKRKGPTLGPEAVLADVEEPSRQPTRLPTRQPLDGSPKRSEAKPSESIPFGQSPNGAREEGTSVSEWEIEGVRDGPSHPDEDGPGEPVAEAYPPGAFGQWWEAWPNKVGIGAAERAFAKVQKSGQVGFGMLTVALERYKRCKPVDRPWCNPATWLNQKRWLDEWPAEAGRFPGSLTDRVRVGPESGVAGISDVFSRLGGRSPTIEGDRP
ncbi:MAG: hypothetical protein ACRYGP_13780 [Janthinobacterium lividum]